MSRITQAAFRRLQGEFPGYVSGDDVELSEFELLHQIAYRQRDDLEAIKESLVNMLDWGKSEMAKLGLPKQEGMNDG